MSVKQLEGKFWPLEIGLKISAKKKNIGKDESGEKRVRVKKEKCVEKLGKHLFFYAKQSDLTHACHSNMPMILLLYNKTYF
jgi:hypothetical protein